MMVLCCNECFKEIAQKDSGAAKMWLDLCAHYVQNEGRLLLRENRVPWTIPLFKTLERLGFISTVDGLDAVSIRVNGYDIIENDENEKVLETFCINRKCHSEPWS